MLDWCRGPHAFSVLANGKGNYIELLIIMFISGNQTLETLKCEERNLTYCLSEMTLGMESCHVIYKWLLIGCTATLVVALCACVLIALMIYFRRRKQEKKESDIIILQTKVKNSQRPE